MLVAVLVVVASGTTTAWFLVGPPARSAAAAEPAAGARVVDGPRVVTVDELRRTAALTGPLYWAGARDGEQYELTRTGSGAVYVRYLPAGASAGTDEALLTVATYPAPRGAAYLETAASSQGARSWRTTSGAFVVVDPRAPLSAYFSFEDVDFQVEVYSPTPGEAQDAVLTGGVSEVGTASADRAGGGSG